MWADFPQNTHLVQEITPANFASLAAQISGSASVDVTGGMLEKVRLMLDLAGNLPGFEARIFSGMQPGSVQQVLSGVAKGTLIHNPGG